MSKYINKLVVIENGKVVYKSKKKRFSHLFSYNYIK